LLYILMAQPHAFLSRLSLMSKVQVWWMIVGSIPHLCHKTYVHRSQWPDVRCGMCDICAATHKLHFNGSFRENLVVYKCIGRWRFITILTRPQQWTLFRTSWIQSTEALLTLRVQHLNSVFELRVQNSLRECPLNRCGCLTINVYKLWTKGDDIMK
jgi:hypothetical protein